VLKCDLHLPVPPIDELLEDIDRPLLTKARDQFAVNDARHERIRANDDEVVWKVKIQRWCGAVCTDEYIPWLIAAGIREDGSADDFYQSLVCRLVAFSCAQEGVERGHPGVQSQIRSQLVQLRQAGP
jgi:hypothetical protein